MEAIQFDVKAKKLQLNKVPLPTAPKSNEVIIQVHYSGVCGTDISTIDGKLNCKKTPFTMGHEICGVVTEIGSAVHNIKRGDSVVVNPNDYCGACQFCCSGSLHLCQSESVNTSFGFFQDGGWANYVKIPARLVYPIPDNVSLKTAALCEPMSCLAHGWDRLQPVAMGSRILVQGAGIIGTLWMSMFHHQGHRNIIVSEPTEDRRQTIKQFGLSGVQVVHPDELKALRAKDPAWGVDVCVDCSGNCAAIESAVDLMRAGGKVILFGIAPPQARSSISPYDMYKKELTIMGTLIAPYTFYKAIGFLESMGETYLSYEKLGVKLYKPSEYAQAYEELKRGSISKAMFQFA